MLECEGKVYIYSTGGGGKSSPDGLVWTGLSASPPWNRALLTNNQGIWAPDGIFLNGQYYLYGSMWSDAKASAIVLLTSPTLNPSSPNYKWTDRGVAIAGPAGVTHSVIDAAPVLDTDGNLWVVWGGGYPFPNEADSIFVTRMDNSTGLPLTSDAGYKPPNAPGYALKQGHKEGPYIHFHGGYYYLFWQTGNCCGTDNPYVMHVARATGIKGPYTGDQVFYSSKGNIVGPGHMGVYSACGFERFTYHYYPSGGGGSVIGENELTWGANGWPVVGAESTTPLKLCGSAGNGGAGGGSAGGTGGGGAGGGGAGGGGRGGVSGGRDAGATGGAGSGGINGGEDAGRDAPTTGGASGSAGTTAMPGTGGASIAGTGGAATGGGSGGSTTPGSGGIPAGSGGVSATGGRSGSGGDLGSVDAGTDQGSTSTGCACDLRAGSTADETGGLFLGLGTVLLVLIRRRHRRV